MRIAVIDLGTNTFNFIISDILENGTQRIFKTKIPVKLGEGGMEKRQIMPGPYARGKDAIKKFTELGKKFGVQEYLAFGTSGIRSAKNGEKFTAEILKEFGIKTRIITGEREAELIWKGVRTGIPLSDSPSLILDIGGGSNEFIITTRDQLLWKQSFDLGMARLMEKFKPSDPFSINDTEKMLQYFEVALRPLHEAAEMYKPIELIGAAGSFESFAQLVEDKENTSELFRNSTSYDFNIAKFFALEKVLLASKHEERKDMRGLVSFRIDMIVPAVLFTAFVLRKYNLSAFRMTTHSLKEGVLEAWRKGESLH